MITDSDTNVVYFSELISSSQKYAPAFGRVKRILDKHNMQYRFLSHTKDIWCRDYMPIQIDVDKFIQFKFEPGYLKNDPHLRSDPKVVLPSNKVAALHIDTINLDGGNVVKWKDKVILTDRIVKENPTTPKDKLISELERILEVPVLLIPDITTDMTGHADGHVRFINGETVLVNTLQYEYAYWRNGFLKMIKTNGLNYVEMPWFTYHSKPGPDAGSAIGCYVNYLEIGELIIFPIFEVENNKDEEAISIIAGALPDKTIEPVNINEIANEGGLLNCATWTIRE